MAGNPNGEVSQRMSWVRGGLCAFVVVLLLSVAGSAHAGERDELELQAPGDGDLELSGDSEITVVSNGAEDLKVSLAVEPAELELAEDGTIDTANVVSVQSSVELRAGQAETVEVTVRGLDVIDLTEVSRGVIVASAGELEASLPFQLRAPVASTAPEPAVASWTLTHTRRLGDDGLKGEQLPLRSAGQAELPSPLAVLQDSDGDSVTVTGTRVEDGKYLELALGDLEPGTTYAGDLDLAPADPEAGTITLTVRSTDPVWGPVIALLVGLTFGIAIKRHLGVGAVVERLMQDSDKAAATGKANDVAFGKALGDNTLEPPGLGCQPTKWSIQESIEATKGEAKDAINELRGWKTLSIDRSSPDYRAAVAAIEKLELASPWGGEAAGELNDLRVAVATLADHTMFGSTAERPALLGAARDHLRGGPIELTKIAEFRERTRWLKTSLASFPETWTAADERRTALNALEGAIEQWQDRRRLADAQRELQAARNHLWAARTAEALEKGRVEERFAQADETIAQLTKDDHGPTSWAAMSHQPAGLAFADRPEFGFGQPIVTGVVSLAKRIAARWRSRRVGLHGFAAAAVVGVVVLVGLLTGLEAVYDGSPFGTSGDYLSAVAWGLGASAVFEALELTLGSLFGHRQPADAESAPGTTAAATATEENET